MKYLYIVLACAASFYLILLQCSKNPGEPIPPDNPCDKCPPVFITCDVTDITVGYIATIDMSAPNVYFVQVEGFLDETITLTKTSPVVTDTTIIREYKGYTGGRISFERVKGSRAEAVGFVKIEEVCAE